MNPLTFLLVILSLGCVGLFWVLPRAHGQNTIAAVTAIILCIISPLAGATLLLIAILMPLAMRWGDARQMQTTILTLYGLLLVGIFLASRLYGGVVWIGAAYYVLRHFHVLFDWWSNRLPAPTVANHLRYQLFLPVVIAGPINRFDHFERECDRRCWSNRNFWSGAERCLGGLFFVVVLSNWALGRVELHISGVTESWAVFWSEWILSGLDWVQLYLSFSGYTSIALGISLMMGLRLEENFNRPFVATNLIEFWSRWHMTLTSWCRDYVFRPVAAKTRSPVIAVLAAMLVLGLWHEISIYYMLWAVWQSLGITVTHLAGNRHLLHLPKGMAIILGPLFVFAWISLARPVIGGFLQLF